MFSEDEEQQLQGKKIGTASEYNSNASDEDDDLKDFIEEDDEHEEYNRAAVGHSKPAAEKKPKSAVSNLWLQRTLSRDALQDLMDIFGDGSEYVALVLKGIKGLQLSTPKKAAPKNTEEATTPEQKILLEDWPERLEKAVDGKSNVHWLCSRLALLFPSKFGDSRHQTDLERVVEMVANMLHSGLDIPLIANHRKDYYIDILNVNELWAVADEDRRWQQMRRKQRVLLQISSSLKDTFASMCIAPIDTLIEECTDEDMLDITHQFFSEIRAVAQGKPGKTLLARSTSTNYGKVAASFCPTPEELARCLKDNCRPSSDENMPVDASDAMVDYAACLFASHPTSHRAMRPFLWQNALVTVTPTAQGEFVINNRHELAAIKYLTRKPADQFIEDDFLLLAKGRSAGLLDVHIQHANMDKIVSKIVAAFSTGTGTAVDALRERIITRSIEHYMCPCIGRDVLHHLQRTAEDWLARFIQHVLQEKLMACPVLGSLVAATIDVASDQNIPTVAAVSIDANGTIVDSMLVSLKREDITDQLVQFIKDAEPGQVLVSGRNCAVFDYFLDLCDRHIDIPVRLAEDDTARLWGESQRAKAEFPDRSALLRYCIGVARRARDPLCEHAILSDDELLGLELQPNQRQVSRETRLKFLHRALINVTSLIGIDPSTLTEHTLPSLRHVCGLGPKSLKLLDFSSITSRNDLMQSIGATRFANCAPFLCFSDSDEPLDRTRVHPENYAIARKMAADALEMEYNDEEEVGRHAIERIFESPASLDDLLLDEYAKELERRLGQKKLLAVMDIRAELAQPFHDRRLDKPVANMSPAAVLEMFTGETETSLCKGQLVMARIVRGRPYDAVIEPSQLQALFLSASRTSGAAGQLIQAAVDHVVSERMIAHLSTHASDLAEPPVPIHGPYDNFYDHSRVKRKKDIALKRETPKPVDPATLHPLFKPHSKGEAERALAKGIIGDAILRPSRSLGTNHFALTWKVDTDIYQHIDIEKVGVRFKIGTDHFDAIDEIIGRHIEPVVSFLHEVRRCQKYFADGREESIEDHLADQRRAEPNRIAYCLSLSRDAPGSVLLSHQSGPKTHHELVMVGPSGFRLRKQPFERLDSMITWFKAHYHDRPTAPAVHASGRDHADRAQSRYDDRRRY